MQFIILAAAATNQFSVLIGQKMQLTGWHWHNGHEMRNAICVDRQVALLSIPDTGKECRCLIMLLIMSHSVCEC